MTAGLSSVKDNPALESSRTTPFFIACAVFLILMECLGYASSKNTRVATDFRQFYAAGYMVRTEPGNLYDLARQKQVQDAVVSPQDIPLPFVHPSYEALLYAPFAMLPYRAAYLSFIAFNVVLLVVVFFVARPLFSELIPLLQPVPGLIFFLFIPLVIAVWQGQDSIFFLLLCCLTWRQLERGKDLSAGCLLALALFRFQLVIPIVLLIAIRRGWRFSAGFVATAVAVVGLCFAMVGREGTMQLMQLLSAVSLSGDQGATAQRIFAMHPLAMPNLFGLLFALGTGHLAARAAFAVTILFYAAVFLWCVYLARRSTRLSSVFAIALLCAVLVSHHLYMHDATLLLLPIVLLAARVPRPVLLIAYYLPLVLFFFVGSNSFFLLAVSTMALLFFASKIEHEPAAMPLLATTPLYTQK